MSTAAHGTDAGDRTVRDLVQREYRRHQLRRGILDHAHLDTPIETACHDREIFLEELSKLPSVGAKAVRVISELLDKADRAARGAMDVSEPCASGQRRDRKT